MLSTEQQLFYDSACSGHNIVLTGQGGTGKSYIISQFYENMLKKGKSIYVTCSTGIAATHYRNAQTLHRWCGLGDGGMQTSELVKLICTDERYAESRQRIISCQILIVDECSMISQRIFEAVESICRSVRQNERYFGGMQVIFSGDFFQLPPVPDELYGETGKHCFQSDYFKYVFPHHINLKTIFRHNDINLIECVNNLEKGNLSTRTIQYIKTLERDISIQENTLYLFSTRYKANLFNHDKINNFPGNLKIYTAKDEGDTFYLQKFQAPKRLGFKVGCPVMLVVNLSETLVNGSTGTLKELLDNEVVVHFEKSNLTVTVTYHAFSKVDPVSRKTLAKRLQLPLVLAFGITMHKSQGMSLESVVVDCEDANVPGQLGVAVGRALTANNLQVKNFRPHLVKKHPPHVYSFYESNSQLFLPSNTCCKSEFIPSETLSELFIPIDWDNFNNENDDHYYNDDHDHDKINDDDDVNFEYDDHFLQLISEIETENNELCNTSAGNYNTTGIMQSASPIPDYISIDKILDEINQNYSNTPLQDQVSQTIDYIKNKKNDFSCWVSKFFLHLNKILNDSFNENEEFQQKHARQFCTKVNCYLQSDEYFNSCQKVISKTENYHPAIGLALFTSTAFHIQKAILENFSETVSHSEIAERIIPTEKYEKGKGNLRYIGGYSIAKIKYKYKKKVQNSLYDFSKTLELQTAREKVDLLNQIITSYYDLLNDSSFPQSLETTARKQNIRQGLTNITDSAFVFFSELNHKLRLLETYQNLYKHGKNTIEMVKSEILADSNILEQWFKLFNSTFDELVLELFNEVISKFIYVSASHFRKDFLRSQTIEKSKAHRKK
ncbi:uncharacterized protein LOC132755380 [Ruditapes philippinarum]|uniref:uncharacterized protein LOC132755380 n=1 Tax=Ruditapes philippinarum TaxID=129788 RepID=UPI00295AC391|nr:uncharacterized protein LOC132755380 [Ruditapes philippinarum]